MTVQEIQAGGGGLGGTLARLGLAVPALGWACAQFLKRLSYDAGLRRRVRLEVPVVSVGNLAVGGTGKTPFVAWLCRALRESGRQPGVLSRGYGEVVVPATRGGPLNDEGAVLRSLLDDVPQVQRADRVAGAGALLADHPHVDLLVLDDGFQHWRVARDLDIVLIDATCPFGYGHYLPRGRLREKPAALARAGAVVVTRTDHVSAEALGETLREIRRHTDVPVAHSVMKPARSLDGAAVFAACGIGNPTAFVSTLESAGARVIGQAFLDDHAAWSVATRERVAAEAKAAGATVVVTRKDAVKLDPLPAGFEVLDIELVITDGEPALRAAIEAAAHRP